MPVELIYKTKTSLTPTILIEVSIPRQESEWSCICVIVVSVLPLSGILIFYFGIVPTVLYFLLLIIAL
jgi:hypothetical protein